MNVRELHAYLGELLPEHGDTEVAYNEPAHSPLHRVTGAIPLTESGPHGWPAFVRLASEPWPSSEWHD